MAFKRLFLSVSFLSLMLLTGCGALGLPAPNSGGASGPVSSPRRTAEAFLEAWNSADIEGMYATISVRSQELYPLPQFNQFYGTMHEQIGFNGLSYTLQDIIMQGRSAAIPYDVTLNSGLFGEIDDPGRTLRLVQEGDQWRVAWSPMDIFEGFTANARISTQAVPSERAPIYDRNGLPVAVSNGTLSALYAREDAMSDQLNCKRLLANILYTPITPFLARFNNYFPETAFFVGEIDPDADAEFAADLDELCGISRESGLILDHPVERLYYGNGAMSHITGYIAPIQAESLDQFVARGYAPDALVGQAGIEQAYEEELAGQPPRVLRIIEPGGTVLRELGRIEGTPARPVYLTIDRELQLETARTVAWGFNYASNNWASPGISPGGGAVVMDIETGAILALASYPTFQPSVFQPDSYDPARGQTIADLVNDPRQPLLNRVLNGAYFPGSIFKIVTTIAFINEGIVGPYEPFYCDLTWDGRATYGDTASPRSDWRLTDGLDATGDIVTSQALTSSCDPWYYEFAAKLFRERERNSEIRSLARYAQEMGMGVPSGIRDFNDTRGTVPVAQTVEEAINNAIGQGETQVTMIQSARMVAAVANGGQMLQPYLVQQVGEGDDAEIFGPTVTSTLPYDPVAMEVTRQGMCDVIEDPEKGTAQWVFYGYFDGPPTYRACGKTGTAQAGDGRAPHAWFVAYAPAENPEIAVVAMAQNSREGSEVAAPMVRRILDAYFGDRVVAFPEVWEEDYVPLAVPVGGTAGG